MDARTLRTFRYERFRAVSAGIIETAGSTFLLLIAVRWFQAGATAKAIVAGGGSLGLLITPWIVSTVAQLGWTTAQAASRLFALGAFSFLLMAAIPLLPVYVVGSVLAMTSAASAVPLLTQIYQENYPDKIRGTLFSKTVLIRIGAAAIFSELAGQTLTGRIELFQLLLLLFALAFGFASWLLARYPAQPLTKAEGTHPFRALRYASEDAIFRRTLICWMLMGFGNLMMLPMRVEVLANPKYGLMMTAGEIAFLTGVVPNVARLVLSPVWGWLFDRMNFFVLRAVLNFGFAVGILSFFTSYDLTGLILGAVIFGISNAGGDIAWSLWVTKFAPPARVADYMSVHTCFTGFRGLAAPLIAFHASKFLTPAQLGMVSAGLIGISVILLLAEAKHGRGAKKSEALVEEVSE